MRSLLALAIQEFKFYGEKAMENLTDQKFLKVGNNP